MRTLDTPLGRFWIDDFSPADNRVGVSDVTVVENRGPDSTHSWSLDQEAALFAAAAAVGAELILLVPGGWRLVPGGSLPRFLEALTADAATRPFSGRQTPPRS